jgi:hypothetical protein
MESKMKTLTSPNSAMKNSRLLQTLQNGPRISLAGIRAEQARRSLKQFVTPRRDALPPPRIVAKERSDRREPPFH